MKKLLIALPFVATASWAGTTLYSGSQTRAAYDDLVAQLDGMTALKVSTESYTSGFAASSAVTGVRASDAPGSPVLFRLHHAISHSPVGLDDGGARVGAAHIVTTLVDDASDEARAVNDLFGGATPIVLESNVGFDRKVSNVLNVAPLALDAEGVKYAFGALRYDVTMDAGERISGVGTFDGGRISMVDEGVEIDFAPGKGRFELARVGKGVFAGEQHVELGRTTIESVSSGLSATLDDVTLDLASSLEDERLSTSFTMAAGAIASPLPLDSLSLGFRLGGIDVAGVESYVAEASEFATLDIEALAPDQIAARLAEMYAGLIAPGLALDYDVAMSNAGGDVVASAGVLFEGDGSASGHESMTTVGDLVGALKLSATLEADADAVAMTPAAMFLAGDQLAPWIVSDGTSYRSELGVDDLVLDINGNPMPLESMAGELLTLPLDLSMLMTMADR